MDSRDVVCARALRKGRGAVGHWILSKKEKAPDKVVQVDLADMIPERLEQSGGIPWGWETSFSILTNQGDM